MSTLSIAYVLQEPIRWEVAPEPLAARRLVGHGGHGEKLRALDVAALRIRDLVPRAAAGDLAADHVAETDLDALSCRPRRAAHPARLPAGILRAREVSQNLVGRGELRPSHRRRRGAQTQRPVETGKRRVIGPSADRNDVHARLEPLPPDDGAGGVGARCKNVRPLADLARLIAGFTPDAIAARRFFREALTMRARGAEYLDPLDLPHLE